MKIPLRLALCLICATIGSTTDSHSEGGGELIFYAIGANCVPWTIHVSSGTEYCWIRDANQQMVLIQSFNYQKSAVANGKIGFDAPTGIAYSGDTLAPWGILFFQISSSLGDCEFTLDLRDENWQSAPYAPPDTYFKIDESASIVYMSIVGGDSVNQNDVAIRPDSYVRIWDRRNNDGPVTRTPTTDNMNGRHSDPTGREAAPLPAGSATGFHTI